MLRSLCVGFLFVTTLTSVVMPHSASAIATNCALIHDIQAAAQVSPCVGQSVIKVPGVVTGLYYSGTTPKGFYMQDPHPDSDAATSEGILVYAPKVKSPAVGDLVQVSGKISEYHPGGASKGELTVTEISGTVAVNVVSSGSALPAPIVIGMGGLMPPNQIIESNPCGNIETCDRTFNPATEGIDFWKSLEGMRVQVNNTVVVGPTNQYYETVIVPDNGRGIANRTPRGGVIITPDNFNPERVYIANDIFKGQGQSAFPTMNVGDMIASVTGILDYDFDNFRIELTSPITPISGGLTQESTTPQSADQLAIATFNMENFSDGVVPGKTAHLATLIVNNLKSPDIVTIEEVQDNSGATDNGVVAADQNWNALISAITAASGPTYKYTEIDPVNDQDGGQPGGNIRQGFLYNPERVSLISRPGGNSTTADNVTCVNGQAQLKFSPGRIDPTASAWSASRKPLAAEFTFQGNDVIVIGNHLVAKLADQPLFGANQPPTLSSADQRIQQTSILNKFVTQITDCNPAANIVITGDLNDFQFSAPIKTLAGNVLDNLMLTLPANEQYSYDFDGNSQVLDQILVSHSVTKNAAPQYDVVHLNSEFFSDVLPNSVRASDHDPSVVRLTLPAITASSK